MGNRSPQQQIERELDVLQILRAMNGTQSEFVAAVRGMQVNGLLYSGSGQIDSHGHWSHSWTVPFAFVHIVNFGADEFTVANDAPQGTPPGYGIGVKRVPGGASLGFNLVGRALTLYGTSGDLFNIEVHIKPDTAG